MPSFESGKVVYRTVFCERCQQTAVGVWDLESDSFTWVCCCTSLAIVGLARSPDGPAVSTKICRERFGRFRSLRFRNARCLQGPTTFVHPLTQASCRCRYLVGNQAILELFETDEPTFQVYRQRQEAGRVVYDLVPADYFGSFAEAFRFATGKTWEGD